MSYLNQCRIKFLDITGSDMPDAEYFGLRGYTSVSRLKLLDPRRGGSPQKYLDGFSMGYNESLLCGTAVHAHILSPDEYVVSDYQGKPSGKGGFFIEKLAELVKSGIDFEQAKERAAILADYYAGKMKGKRWDDIWSKGEDYYNKLISGELEDPRGREVLVLSPKLLETTHQCINSINRNYAIQSILKQNIFEPKQYYNEIALFSNIEVTFPDGTKAVVPFKGKLDSVVYDPEKSILYLNDVKTTSKQIEYFMDYVYEGVGYEGVLSHSWYYGQLAAYQILLQKYFQEVLHITDYTLQTNFFVVETTGEHRSDVKRLNNSYIDTGIQEFKELICRLAWHQTYGFDKEFPESVQV